MKKFFWCLLLIVFWGVIPPVFAQDSNEISSDSGVLVSSPTQTSKSELNDSGSLDNENSDDENPKPAQDPASNTNDDSTNAIIEKAADLVMFQITANMRLTQDNINAIRLIVIDNIVKVRDLQQKLQEGNIDSKAMYDQREGLTNEENQKLSAILTADQMKVWLNIQAR